MSCLTSWALSAAGSAVPATPYTSSNAAAEW
eukprot:CAMPEP_0173193080 /NCGR_PEP_ID=MMETSP1141-20130122/13768_1 /TAXON_ID=483371 /ORGANISM="non described non described, Strain CCMP2298" /LENGTH=30 /DNA_ID= /DNA_START= /DNA_END= /DNA_ORIENTATION=